MHGRKRQIDRFLLAKMEGAGVKPSGHAAPRELVRRLYFDLIGMPPSPEEVAAFEKDPGEARYAAMVEKLLASPHYGERWGRYWLDLARYADRTPDWLESTSASFRYRDWVVKALNDDMRYDEFVMRQLAVDQMPGFKPTDLPSLGFLGLSPTYFKELQLPPEIIRTTVADEWEEHVDAVGRTFLGLTLACARCHDHKSDPVTREGLLCARRSVREREDHRAPDDGRRDREARAQGPRQKSPSSKRKSPRSNPRRKRIRRPTRRSPNSRRGSRSSRPRRTTTWRWQTPSKTPRSSSSRPTTRRAPSWTTSRRWRAISNCMKRGDPNSLGEVVPRGFLSSFGSRKFTTGSGRLELAKALDRRCEAAHGARDRQPHLETSLWPRPRRYAERVRQSG